MWLQIDHRRLNEGYTPPTVFTKSIASGVQYTDGGCNPLQCNSLIHLEVDDLQARSAFLPIPLQECYSWGGITHQLSMFCTVITYTQM